MASFPLKNAHLFYLLHSVKIVKKFLALDRRNFACLGLKYIANYLRKFFKTYTLAITDDDDDGQTAGRQPYQKLDSYLSTVS